MLHFSLAYEFENSCPPFVVTFYTEEDGKPYECASFRFNDKAFKSVEEALSLLTGIVGNNLVVHTAFGYMTVTTSEEVYYDDIEGVAGFAEVKNYGSIFNAYLDVKLFYPESITIDEIYRLLEEDVDIKSYKPNIEQLFDY